jgi:hypothetical protein
MDAVAHAAATDEAFERLVQQAIQTERIRREARRRLEADAGAAVTEMDPQFVEPLPVFMTRVTTTAVPM